MFTRKFGFQRHYIVVMMLTLGSTLSFMMVHSAMLTLLHLLECFSHCEYDYDQNYFCPAAEKLLSNENQCTNKRNFLECTINEKGLLVGLIVSHIPAGAISDIYGGKHLVGLSILMTSVIVSLLPVIISHYHWSLMTMTNLLIGLLMGITKAGSVSLLAHWLPKHQRTLLGCIYFCGEILGVCLGANMFNSIVLESSRWELFFYLWSAVGLLYYLIFVFTVYASAKTHPHLPSAEQDLLKKGMHFPSRIPWKKILKEEAVWAIFAAQVGQNFTSHLLFDTLPKYLKFILGLDMKSIELNSIPPLCLILLAVAIGYLADRKVKKKFIPIGYLRCLYISLGNLVPPCLAIILLTAGCNYYPTATIYSLSVMTHGPILAGLKINIFDLTYYYSGAVYGLTNGPAGIFSIIASVMFRFIKESGPLVAWQYMFAMDVVISLYTSLLYFISMRGERVSWDAL